MKQLLTVRSNSYFTQEGKELKPYLELILISVDGKEHKINRKYQIVSEPKLIESRLIVSPETLTQLITELQLHKKKLDAVRNNAEQMNSLIKTIMEETKK
jgi:phosphotransacetylase